MSRIRPACGLSSGGPARRRNAEASCPSHTCARGHAQLPQPACPVVSPYPLPVTHTWSHTAASASLPRGEPIPTACHTRTWSRTAASANVPWGELIPTACHTRMWSRTAASASLPHGELIPTACRKHCSHLLSNWDPPMSPDQ